MSDSILELAVAYGQAWASHDPDAIVALHTEDAVFHLHDVMSRGSAARQSGPQPLASSPTSQTSASSRYAYIWETITSYPST
jgi:hypothetical protein